MHHNTHPFQTLPARPAVFGLLAAAMFSAAGHAWAQGKDNPRAVNVESQFSSMKHNGISLAFHTREGVEDPGDGGSHHAQGIARADIGGVPYIFLSHNNYGGMINIARMDSRGNESFLLGERLRSNLLRRFVDTDNTVPPQEDAVVANIRFTGSGDNFLGSGHPFKFEHPGGMQIIDDMLVVACVDPVNWSPSRSTAIAIIDVSTPTAPKHRFTLWGPSTIAGKAVNKCGAVGIMKDPRDGRYVIAAIYGVEGEGENYLGIFQTSVFDLRDLPEHGNSLSDPNATTLIDTWSSAELGSDATWWEGGGDGRAFQSINFVVQDDGALFLWCGRSTDGLPDSGNEYMYLFNAWFESGNQFKLSYFGRKELNRDYAHSGQIADFGAAGGVTVTPSGQIIVYGAPHSNAGPSGPGGATQRFGEYYNERLVEQNIVDYRHAYIELYEDTNGWHDQGSRSVVLEAHDRVAEDYNNLALHEDFDNRARSFLFVAPPGVGVKLWDRAGYAGKSKTYWGTGGLVIVRDLDQVTWDDGSTTLAADGVEAVQFVGNPLPITVRVLDHQGYVTFGQAFNVLQGNKASGISLPAGSYSGSYYLDRPFTLTTFRGPATLGN